MANVSKIVGTYVIPIMVGAYCLFLWWDDQNFSDFGRRDILSRHYENLAELETIDGIIVGGSNAYYGISAGLISQKLDEDWYNASLIMEGFSYANYNSFVSDIAAQIDTANVNNVIYSTVLPYR